MVVSFVYIGSDMFPSRYNLIISSLLNCVIPRIVVVMCPLVSLCMHGA